MATFQNSSSVFKKSTTNFDKNNNVPTLSNPFTYNVFDAVTETLDLDSDVKESIREDSKNKSKTDPLTLDDFNKLVEGSEKTIDEKIEEYTNEKIKYFKQYQKFTDEVTSVIETSDDSFVFSHDFAKLVKEEGGKKEALDIIFNSLYQDYMNYQISLSNYQKSNSSINEKFLKEAKQQLLKNKYFSYINCLESYNIYSPYDGENVTEDQIINTIGNFVSDYGKVKTGYENCDQNIENLNLQKKTLKYNLMSTQDDYINYKQTINRAPKDINDVADINSDLQKMYNYIYDRFGEEEAKKYYDSIEEYIIQCQGAQIAKKQLEYFEKNPDSLSDFINNFAASTGTGVGMGVEQFLDGFSGWSTAFDDSATGGATANDYASMYTIQQLMSKSQKEEMGLIVKDENGNYVNADASSPIDYTIDYGNYDEVCEFSTMLGYMAIPVGASALTTYATGGLGIEASAAIGSWTATGLIFLSAGGNAVKQAKQDGAEPYKALIYGLINGTSQALLEKFLGNIPGIGNAKVEDMSSFLKSLPKELLEENAQNVVNWVTDSMILGKDVSVEELFEQTGKTIVYTTLVSFLFNAPGIAKSKKETRQWLENATVEEIMDLYKNSGIEIKEETARMIKNETGYLKGIKWENANTIVSILKDTDNIDKGVYDVLSEKEKADLELYIARKKKDNPDFDPKLIERTQYGEVASSVSLFDLGLIKLLENSDFKSVRNKADDIIDKMRNDHQESSLTDIEIIEKYKNEFTTLLEEQYIEIVKADKVEWNTNKRIGKILRYQFGQKDWKKLGEDGQAKKIEEWKNNPDNKVEYEGMVQDEINSAEDIAKKTINQLKKYEEDGIFMGVNIYGEKINYSYSDILLLIEEDINPEKYLNKEYVEKWREEWTKDSTAKDGYVKICTFQAEKKGLLAFNGSIGRDEGTFGLTESQKNTLMDPNKGYYDKKTQQWVQIFDENGNIINRDALSKALGNVELGSGKIVLVEQEIKLEDLKMAKGSLEGAFKGDWIPGGKTSEGLIEGLVDHHVFDTTDAEVGDNYIINKEGNIKVTEVTGKADGNDMIDEINKEGKYEKKEVDK